MTTATKPTRQELKAQAQDLLRARISKGSEVVVAHRTGNLEFGTYKVYTATPLADITESVARATGFRYKADRGELGVGAPPNLDAQAFVCERLATVLHGDAKALRVKRV